jgi:hypothetical protein
MRPRIDRGDVLANRWVADALVDVTLHGASGRSGRPSGQRLHHRREATSSVRSVEPNRGVGDATVDVTCIDGGVGRTHRRVADPTVDAEGRRRWGRRSQARCDHASRAGSGQPMGGVVLAAVEQTGRRGCGRMSRRRGRVTPRSSDHSLDRVVGSATVGGGVREVGGSSGNRFRRVRQRSRRGQPGFRRVQPGSRRVDSRLRRVDPPLSLCPGTLSPCRLTLSSC